jgi:hypothetical protein
MENENDIVRLLTEIRDNQAKQVDAQKKYQEWAHATTAKHQRRAVIVGIIVGIGAALLLAASRM